MSCMSDVYERRSLCTYYLLILEDKNIDCFMYLTVCYHFLFCSVCRLFLWLIHNMFSSSSMTYFAQFETQHVSIQIPNKWYSFWSCCELAGSWNPHKYLQYWENKLRLYSENNEVECILEQRHLIWV